MLPLTQITPLIEEKLGLMGLELYDIKLLMAGSRPILRIFIDKQGGVTIGDCELASNELSVLLDVENFSAGAYTLEVSSPGVDRPLKQARDFRRNAGHVARVQVKEPIGGAFSFTGRIISCENDVLLLEMENNDSAAIACANILSGKIEVEFK
jgi:ribosome maturation factor RimP